MSRKKDTPMTTLYLRPVPKYLHQKFKAWCTVRGLTMKDKVVELMRKTIEEPVVAPIVKRQEVLDQNGLIPKTLFLPNFPRSVRNHFKAWCELRNITMTDKMVQLMREVTKEMRV